MTRFTLAYRDESGAWQERWNARDVGGLPTAVRLELAGRGAQPRDAGARGGAAARETGPVTKGARPGRRLSERGVALIVVLLLLALLLTIVGEFAQAMRLEAVTAANFRSGIAETWLAEAAYQRALAEVLPDALVKSSTSLAFSRSVGLGSARRRSPTASTSGSSRGGSPTG